MSRVKPILFNTDMVRAILDGRKTVTRRLIKVPSYYPHFYELYDNTDGAITGTKNELFAGFYKDEQVFYIDGEKHINAVYYKAPCKPGDILYVRESFVENSNPLSDNYGKYEYRADYYGATCEELIKWRPSIHMPKEAARIWLKVMDVSVERLQDITNEDIRKEGIEQKEIDSYIGQMPYETDEYIRLAHTIAFRDVWNPTIKNKDQSVYGWEANPWVWRIAFERCEKPEEV